MSVNIVHAILTSGFIEIKLIISILPDSHGLLIRTGRGSAANNPYRLTIAPSAMQTPLPASFDIRRAGAGPRDIPASPHPPALGPAVDVLPSGPPQGPVESIEPALSSTRPASAVLTPFVRRLLWLKGEPARPMRTVTAPAGPGIIPRAREAHPAPASIPAPVYLVLLISLTPSLPPSRAY